MPTMAAVERNGRAPAGERKQELGDRNSRKGCGAVVPVPEPAKSPRCAQEPFRFKAKPPPYNTTHRPATASNVLLLTALTATPAVTTAASSTADRRQRYQAAVQRHVFTHEYQTAGHCHQAQHEVGSENGRQPRVPFAQEILIAADAAAEHGIGQRAALGGDAAGRVSTTTKAMLPRTVPCRRWLKSCDAC